MRFIRIARFLARSDRYSFLLPRVLPHLAVCLLLDGFGEAIGYLSGPGSSPGRLGAIEFNRLRFMNADDRSG